MEVSLRKPQRVLFETLRKYQGSFLRKHKKSLQAKRVYYRLMTADVSPIKNIPYGVVRPFINLDLLDKRAESAGDYYLKEDVTLIIKQKKAQ